MKRIAALLFLCFGLILTVGSATAESGGFADGYGKKLDILKTWDHSGLDRTNIDDARTIRFDEASLSLPSQVLWTPDGKSILYTTMNGLSIWSVPVEGGAPRLVFDNLLTVQYKTYTNLYPQTPLHLGGISPDGKYLYFTRAVLDTLRGAVLQIHENSNGGYSGTSCGIYVLERLDLTTGKSEEIMEGAVVSDVSASGRYLAYYRCVRPNTSYSNLCIMDLFDGRSWELPAPGFDAAFTSDEKDIIYSSIPVNNANQLFRIPVVGGEPEQISTWSGGPIGQRRDGTDCAPDGEWALYTDQNYQKIYSNTISHEGGSSSYTKGIVKLCAFNVRTGDAVDLLPLSTSIDCQKGKISPDGTKFCYIWRDWNVYPDAYGIYIRDFNPAAAGAVTPLAVDDAVPSGFALAGNYPNPFNPSTTIEFSVLTPGATELAIYDVTGRKVRDLVSGYIHQGRHAAIWDGRDAAGSPVASGTYIARLRMGDAVSSRRMMLVK